MPSKHPSTRNTSQGQSNQWSAWIWSEEHGEYYRQRFVNGAWETQWQSQLPQPQSQDESEPRTTDAISNAFAGMSIDPRSSHESDRQEYSYGSVGRSDPAFGYSESYHGTATQAYPIQSGIFRHDRDQVGYGQPSTSYNAEHYGGTTQTLSSGTAQPSSSSNYGKEAAYGGTQRGSTHLTTQQDGVDYDRLDSSYSRVSPKSISSFFREGRVFALLWVEPTSNTDPNITTGFSVARFGEQVFAEIRRFIVVRVQGNYHSICVPIMSYGGRGVVGRNDALHHSIAYTSRTPPSPSPNETMNRHPIKVDPRGGNLLNAMSRINFSKVYTVEHNLKVKNIGSVPEEHMAWVRYYYRISTNGSDPLVQPAYQPHDDGEDEGQY